MAIFFRVVSSYIFVVGLTGIYSYKNAARRRKVPKLSLTVTLRVTLNNNLQFPRV